MNLDAGNLIQDRVDLTPFNTLRIRATARYFAAVHSVAELQRARTWAREHRVDCVLIGGGSNLVIAGDIDGLVVAVMIRDRHWDSVNGDQATLVLGAGENWHESVMYAAGCGYRGIENLALIPGSAGAAPVQNIGAYGVELKESLTSLRALDWETGRLITFSRDECRFAYRDSLFKQAPGRYVIVDLALRLSRSRPLSLGYGELADYFSNVDHVDTLTALEVAEGVMAIRRRKLPDPAVLPNVGSFFKNPVVAEADWASLKERYPGIVAFPVVDGIKLAAGWLIDQCGWKGFRDDRVGVHSHQALVLVNHGDGSGQDVLALARRIREDVAATFGVSLEMEPRVIAAGDSTEVNA